MKPLLKLLDQVYAWLLRLYPRGYRDEYGDELRSVFRLAAGDAVRQGSFRLWAVAGRELVALPVAALRQHRAARRERLMSGVQPSSFGWREILIVTLPLMVLAVLSNLLVAQESKPPMALLLALAAIPAVTISLAEAVVVHQGETAVIARRRIDTLLVIALAMLVWVALLLAMHTVDGYADLVAVLLIPTICGVLASMASNGRELFRRRSPAWWMLGAGLLLVLGVIRRFDPGALRPNLPFWILALSLVLALLWAGAKRVPDRWLVVASLVSLLWGLISMSKPRVLTSWETPARLQAAATVMTVLALNGALLLPAVLIHHTYAGGALLSRWRSLLRLSLAVLLVAVVAYSVVWEAIWDSAHSRVDEDNLPFLQVLAVIAAGVMLTGALPGRRKLAGMVYLAGMTAVLMGAFYLGWSISAFDLTAARAERVDQAIQRFHQEQGRYPATLDELSPRYLLFVPRPVVLRHQSWCYVGGEHFFRLGYVTGAFSYSDAMFFDQTYAMAGDASLADWECAALARRYARGEIPYW